ncbi:hypothetical protein N0V84_011916 [Fusarium piperis]|uniref:Helicase C-terminal domain-containing protein n=1 Tax=Fusarium piperis TaxID=1435070 RepID=A0A9W8W3X8_9HYPO|nr:hypothetical protein N0V84_011916 [Fusarium piperis]
MPRLHEDASQSDGSGQDASLLHLFNNIPSPNPEPESIIDPYSKSVMYDLLQSQVPGLKSQLYPYQRRSAALMLQKEVQPGTVLDPRLLHVKDQESGEWYLDPVAGTVLKEPRYYDGVSGGILAEEMGSGKTIMSLALILATRSLPTHPPEHFRAGDAPVRKRLASLSEMAASCATRNSVPWRPYFDLFKEQSGDDYERCIETLEGNPGYYYLPPPEPHYVGRRSRQRIEPPKKLLYLSGCSLVIVPANLVEQWEQEIRKHTEGLKVLVIARAIQLPSTKDLLKYDLILLSQTRLETLARQGGGLSESPLSNIHFKRCIFDEGHKLGNSSIRNPNNLLNSLDSLNFSSRWAVTGTPSQGLFGVDAQQTGNGTTTGNDDGVSGIDTARPITGSSPEMEKRDLERIGSLTAVYLKARPWANKFMDVGDTRADPKVYLMLPKHTPTGQGRWDCLKSTLNSLIIRHQFAEVGDLLPPVDHKVVVLEGSYQDQLSVNLFSMMIIFNAVQSQRTDRDYFFHPKQRESLNQLVRNLQQACFFGGSFFSKDMISTAVNTAEEFLRSEKVPISADDKHLLEKAIRVGYVAMENEVRTLSNRFHELPVCVNGFPHNLSSAWSLDGDLGDAMCSSSGMLLALQMLIYKSASKPEQLNSLLNGRLIQEGALERSRMLDESLKQASDRSATLAGNTKLGNDSHKATQTLRANVVKPKEVVAADGALGPLEGAKITSTASSKLSYLIDSIIKHQEDEKIVIFYENENAAWYLASVLETLQIQHLIYARGLTNKRKGQYVKTFLLNSDFRVLLMDITQAAFGLDIRVASRIYFISPVLNPQVEAQAIGRARRISQQKPVSVETLVLRNSIEEIIIERKQHMTQAEHDAAKTILHVERIYNWIKDARIIPLPNDRTSKESQMAPLRTPQYVFGRGFGRTMHPDDGLVLDDSPTRKKDGVGELPQMTNGLKRGHEAGPGANGQVEEDASSSDKRDLAARPARRVRFTVEADEE